MKGITRSANSARNDGRVLGKQQPQDGGVKPPRQAKLRMGDKTRRAKRGLIAQKSSMGRGLAPDSARKDGYVGVQLDGDRSGLGFVYDFAVEEMDGAFGVVGVTRVMGDHADGGAAWVDVLEKFHYGVAIFGVEVSGGLIGEENHGIAYERACHRDALLLPTGKLCGIVLRAMSHLDAFEGVELFPCARKRPCRDR